MSQVSCGLSFIVQDSCTIVNMKELKIADNIRFFRKANNLTQEELSKQLGGSKNLVSNYENGISTPDIYTLVKLADIFDITLDELVGRE